MLLAFGVLVGCGASPTKPMEDGATTDGAEDRGPADAADGTVGDARTTETGAADSAADQAPGDSAVGDSGVTDGARDDVPTLDGDSRDRATTPDLSPPLDASPDARRDGDPLADSSTPRDTSADAAAPVDTATPMDTAVRDTTIVDSTTPMDTTVRDTAIVDSATPMDTAVGDTTTVDTGTAGCTGSGPVITGTAPAANAMIETCSESGRAVYYDFTAAVVGSSPIREVRFNWRTPDGALAPPPPPPMGAPPYRFLRQVGGSMGAMVPLAVFGLRGTWGFEVSATDACGRTTSTSQPFTLIYTTRRCPNP